jgi:hypothetical protein
VFLPVLVASSAATSFRFILAVVFLCPGPEVIRIAALRVIARTQGAQVAKIAMRFLGNKSVRQVPFSHEDQLPVPVGVFITQPWPAIVLTALFYLRPNRATSAAENLTVFGKK